MDKKIYDLMDWAAIEAVVYGETNTPQELLGPHNVGRQTLVQAFFPGSKKATLYIDGAEKGKGKTVKEEIKMEQVDEAGYYAALLSGKDRRDYSYHVEYETDKLTKTGKKSVKSYNFKECYCYTNLITEKMVEKYSAGTATDAYELLGSTLMTVDNVRGCRFAVWAPNAERVSVVGDFNNWNELMHQMMKNEATGIYEIFIPGVEEGDKYKYQILTRGSAPYFKADPYCLQLEAEEGKASIVSRYKGYKWTDSAYMKAREKKDILAMPFNAYEVCLSSFADGMNAKEKTASLISYVKEMGYTHVELMPIMESAKKESAGYAVTEFYAVDSSFGEADDYRYLVNELHKENIGVIMQWPVQSFDDSQEGLARFDGSGLYEHEDPRQGIDPRNGKHMFQYGRPEVYSFLVSNACYFAKEFHFDGLKFCDLASILYLDFYRNPDEWVPNIYGGNENLDSIDFVKSINETLHKAFPGFITIAEDESCWPNLTVQKGNTSNKQAEFESLGFDLAVDFGYNADILEYMHADPIDRKNLHDKLTMASIYQYNENFVLPIMHQNTGFQQGGLLEQMPGEFKDKIANLKVLYGYNMLRVGKKQMFMGQDYGASESFAADVKYDYSTSETEGHKELKEYCKAINKFYLEHKWLYENENDSSSFSWLNEMSANENVISFVRRGKKAGEEITVIINFANTEYIRYRFGSEMQGKFKEIFSSDCLAYYGENRINEHIIPTRESAYDGKDYSFALNLAPLSMVILSFTPYTDAELEDIQKRKEIRDKKRQEKEEERKKRIADREKKQHLLAMEKMKIRKELKKELERRYIEAEEKIFGKSKNSNTCNRITFSE